jgi:hypothetical protein
MSEFELSDATSVPERTPELDGDDLSLLAPEEHALAARLCSLFSLEQEEIPPLYVETLVGDSRHSPLESGFEQKITYQVFRRLGLERRHLFALAAEPEPIPLPARVRGSQTWEPLRRLGRLSGTAVACVAAFMLVSIVLASPSFASGVRLLLGHSGIQPVSSYPSGVVPSSTMAPHRAKGAPPSPPLTQIDWLGRNVAGYVYENTLVNAPAQWSDGPVVELIYERPGNTPGSGLLDVREFRLSPAYAGVLLVVQQGSAIPVMVGNQQGVYVDGRWVRTGLQPTWQFGVKSELIFERDGFIFWIVGDQRDGAGQGQLIAAAGQLQSVALSTLVPSKLSLHRVSQDLQGDLQSPIAGETYGLILAGSSLDSGAEQFVTFSSQPGMR